MYYILFSFNIPVRGSRKSVIYNLQKSKLIFIPGVMIDFIDCLRSMPIQEVKKSLSQDSKKYFDDYMKFLIDNQLGFYTTNVNEFPDLNLEWKVPSSLIACVIEYDCFISDYSIEAIINELEELNCLHIEFFVKKTTREFLDKMCESTFFKSIKSINLYIEYTEEIEEILLDFFIKNKKIEYVLVYNATDNSKRIDTDRIVFTRENILKRQFIFPKDEYIVNVKYFTESLRFHPFFNRKVCVDYNGEVKNDLSFKTCFGNIKEESLYDILEFSCIKDLWYACPDRVLEYKEDVLRYCRVYTDELVKLENGYFKIK